MKKIYFFLFTLFVTNCFYGQHVDDDETSIITQETTFQKSDEIKDFIIYPNPVVNGKLFIKTFNNADKKIQIFNILGKQVMLLNLRGSELNLSKLDAGVYILKVFEGNKTSTRKLVIK